MRPAATCAVVRVRGALPVSSHIAATLAATPAALSSQLPRFIGEEGLNTRNMLKNRSDRPRSFTSRIGLAVSPAAATTLALRASRWLPVALAASASVDEPPASPPVNRYQAISSFQTGGLMIGL